MVGSLRTTLSRPWPQRRVLFSDAQLLVVDKISGFPVHGGDAERPDDVVRRLSMYLEQRHEPGYLGVHQRLDKAASGVLLFARTSDANQLMARELRKRSAVRRYLACVTAEGLPDQGRLEHRLTPLEGGRVRVVQRGGKLCKARFRVLERVGVRALLELFLETGRTHQLRVQLSATGAPIAGDLLYGGARTAPRLLLHAAELCLPALAREFVARSPAAFDLWLRQKRTALFYEGLRDDDLFELLADAACLRASLALETQALRWVNEARDGLPGVRVEVFGDWAVIDVLDAAVLGHVPRLAQALCRLGAQGVYLKRRLRADLRRQRLDELSPREPVCGTSAPDPLVVSENGVRYAVSLADGLSTGLFVDQRDNRRLLAGLCRNRRLLNLFCYTGSFSVAAALKGATTTNVDLSRKALERARENFRSNRLDPEQHRFVQSDVEAWLKRADKRGDKFDAMVFDPPSFGTTKNKSFSVSRDYERLATGAMRLLAPGGSLLAVTNHKKTSPERLHRMLKKAAFAAGRSIGTEKQLRSPLDCSSGPSGPEAPKSVLLTLV